MNAVAAVWHGPGIGFKIEEIPLPVLGPGETLVEIELATVCGSDLHTIRGERATAVPTVLGHEMIGRVVRGERAAGTRVTWSICTSCGSCARCRRGFANKCINVRKYGHEAIEPGWALSGGFASHCQLTADTALVEVPADLPDRLVAPAGCATATVVGAVRRAGACTDDVVVIQGCGLLGLTAVAYARHLGARAIIACDIDPARLDVAARLGASAVTLPDGLAGSVAELSGGAGADLVVEVSGSNAAISAGLSHLGIGGRLALVGSVFPGPPVDLSPEAVVRGLHTIVGSHNYLPADLEAAVRFLAETDAATELAGLVSDPYEITAIDDAITAAITGPHPRVSLRPTRI